MAAPQDGREDPNPKHTLFCRMVGIAPNINGQFYSTTGISARDDRKYTGLYPRVRKQYKRENFYYGLITTLSNSLLWIQIIFGAALTGLGGTKSDKVSIAIIVLGGLQTVFGGFLTFFKSRNQPNRARQARRGLKKVLDAIENAEGMLRDPDYVPPAYTPISGSMSMLSANEQNSWFTGAPGVAVTGVQGMVLRLMDMYMDVIREAESNYPDFWLAMRRDNGQQQLDVMSSVLEELRKSGAIQTPKDDKDVKETEISSATKLAKS